MKMLRSLQETLQMLRQLQTNTINVFDVLKYNTVIATKAAVASNRGGVRIMANIQYYDVILKPVVTEKSMELMAEKKYTFLCTHRGYKDLRSKRL